MSWLRSNRPDGQSREPGDRLAAITPGVPGHCPACDGLGYIDNIDLGHRYQIQHCKDCGHRWEYLFDEDGAVVGLTELDERGQPRSRTRVRPLRAPDAPDEEAAEGAVEEAVDAGTADDTVDEPAEEPPGAEAAPVDEVIDLRQPVVAPAVGAAPTVDAVAVAADGPGPRPEEMSPAEWLRHSLGR